MKHELSEDTQLKIIAIHKVTFKETITFMRYIDWVNLNKSTKFYYKAVGL